MEEVNRLVNSGMPFRDAYKKVGLDIESGDFTYDPHIHHTHEGSIGNLGTLQIREQMNRIVAGFPFARVQAAVEELTR